MAIILNDGTKKQVPKSSIYKNQVFLVTRVKSTDKGKNTNILLNPISQHLGLNSDASVAIMIVVIFSLRYLCTINNFGKNISVCNIFETGNFILSWENGWKVLDTLKQEHF